MNDENNAPLSPQTNTFAPNRQSALSNPQLPRKRNPIVRGMPSIIHRANARIHPPVRYVPVVRTDRDSNNGKPIEGRSIRNLNQKKQYDWAYGITTIHERRKDLLPQTITSLRNGGFENPTLFIDGEQGSNYQSWFEEFHLPLVFRYPRIRAYGNWILALAELYIRQPFADYYALFQDDIITSLNLRQYIESVPYPKKGYLNLYTFPDNQVKSRGRVGFYSATGGWRGLGALGLVFNLEAVTVLLAHNHMVKRIRNDPERRYKYIDGGVVETLNQEGFTEFVHNPSLLQHTGQLNSSVGKFVHPLAPSFQGESFDLMTLLTPQTNEKK